MKKIAIKRFKQSGCLFAHRYCQDAIQLVLYHNFKNNKYLGDKTTVRTLF